MAKLRFGIIGAGRIAGAFAHGSSLSKSTEVVAVGSRNHTRAQAFAAERNIPRAHGSYQDLIDDHEVEAVYIATPNGVHKENTLAAARAGKHILCEKPFACSEKDAIEMFEAADKSGVVLLEGFPYRYQPQTQDVLRRVASGELGELRTVSAGFGFTLTKPDDPRWNPELGGGSLWDVGVYPISLIRALMGSRPSKVQASALFTELGVDRSASAVLTFPDGRSATMWCSFETPGLRRALVITSNGAVDFTYTNGTENANESCYQVLKGTDWRSGFERYEAAFGNGFSLEADGFASAVAGNPNLGTTPQESIDVAWIVEQILRSARA